MAKKTVICVLIAVLACLTVFLPAKTAFASAEKSYALHEGVPVYADKTLGEVVTRLKQNQEVVVSDKVKIDGIDYYFVTANGSTGYVNAFYVYTSAIAPEYKVVAKKIIAEKVGRTVKIYAKPDTASKVLDEVADGVNVNVVVSDGEFYTVVTDDYVGYVQKSNVTDGLSRNQTVALIVGVVTVTAVVAILVLLYYRRNKEHFERRKRG